MSSSPIEPVDIQREPERRIASTDPDSARSPNGRSAQYALDATLSLPHVMTCRRIDDRVLFIVPEKSLWLTVSEIGASLVQRLRRGASLRQSLEEVAARQGLHQETVRRELRAVLRQIEIKGFNETCVPAEPPLESGLRNLQIHLTQSCNLRCRHCYMDSGVESSAELGLDDWKHVIDQYLGLGGTSVTYSGGEPLLSPHFFELATYAHQTPLETLLITNGTLIESEATARAVAAVVDKVRVSVDGGTAEAHELIRGEGTFEPTRRALVLLAEAGVPIELAVTMYPENQHDIVDNLAVLLDELAELGVRPVKAGISRGMRQGRASRVLDVLEFEKSFLEAKRRAYGQLWDLKRFKAVKVRSCGYGATLTVLSTGEVLPCGITDGTGVHVREQPLEVIYRRFKARGEALAVTNLRPCRRCDLRYICGGGCRIVHRSTHGDARHAACSSSDRKRYYRRLMARDEVFFKISGMLDTAER